MFSDQTFNAHLASLDNPPSWWVETKRAAWGNFNKLPLPARTDETWRFSDTAMLDLANFAPAGAATTLGRFGGGDFFPQPAGRLPSGVVFLPLTEALAGHGGLVREFFQKFPANLGGEKFTALNTALTRDGALLYVPDNTEIPEPLLIRHDVPGENAAFFPHTLIILGKNAKATLVEHFASGSPAARHLVSGVNDLHAGPGARLAYIGAQNWSANTLAFQTNSIVAQRDARILSLNVHLGGRLARHESHSRLQGPGAHSEMLALTVAAGAQHFDQRTLQTHQAPHTSSNLLYKNALLDTARTVFSGLITVEPDAQKTDAYQSNRNLMLSDEAGASSLPGLEIQANDVRCTHGATSARIPAEQEFYLRSRGIDPGQARELLIAGFFEEVLAKLENEELQATLRVFIETKCRKIKSRELQNPIS